MICSTLRPHVTVILNMPQPARLITGYTVPGSLNFQAAYKLNVTEDVRGFA